MKITLIGGSLRDGSYTTALMHSVGEKLIEKGAEVFVWDLFQNAVPHTDPAYHHTPFDNPDTNAKKLLENCVTADGLIFVTPVYHNSFSGVLKDVIDLLTIKICTYKTVGLMSHGGNRTSQAVDQLRIVARGLNTIAIPTQICTSGEDYETKEGKLQLTAEPMLVRVDRFCNELLSITELTQSLRNK
jgi:NAD(P)H-dependent FMN reductase